MYEHLCTYVLFDKVQVLGWQRARSIVQMRWFPFPYYLMSWDSGAPELQVVRASAEADCTLFLHPSLSRPD